MGTKADYAGNHLVWSKALGLQRCEIVGRNEERVLIRLQGLDRPLSVARSRVFEIGDGFTVEQGRIVQQNPASPPPEGGHGEGDVGANRGRGSGTSGARGGAERERVSEEER